MGSNINQVVGYATKLESIKTFKNPNVWNSINQKEYNKFVKEVQKVYGNESIIKVIKEHCLKNGELVGEGNSKKVFKIKGIKNFFIALVKNEYKGVITNKFKAVDNPLSDYNFGQFIATNNEGLYITQKVEGSSHSLPNWIAKYVARNHGQSIKEKDAQFVLKQIEKVAKFPLSSFEHLASELKYLNEKNIRIDPINPNNLLVEEEGKQLNIIDLEENQEVFSNLLKPLNGSIDMIALMLDSLLHYDYKQVLTIKDDLKLGKYAKEIIEKCKSATNNVMSDSTKENIHQHFSIIQDIHKNDPYRPALRDDFEKFESIYQDIL